MGDNSAIEWCDHTLSRSVNCFVTALTKSNPISQIKAQIGMRGERLNVVSVQVAAFRIAAMLTGKVISAHYVKPPCPSNRRLTDVFSLPRLAVQIAMTGRTAWRSRSCTLADQCSRLSRVFNASPVASARLS